MSRWKIAVVVALGAPLVLAVVATIGWALTRPDDDTVVRNVAVSGVPVGGMQEDELVEVVAGLDDEWESVTVEVDTGDATLTAPAADLGLTIDTEATARDVLEVGHDEPGPAGPWRWFRSLFSTTDVDLVLRLDRQAAVDGLRALEGDARVLVAEPSFTTLDNTVIIEPGVTGSELDVDDALGQLPRSFGEAAGTVTVRTTPVTTDPRVSDDEAQEAADYANLITAAPFVVTYGEGELEIDASALRPGMRLDTSTSPPGLRIDEQLAGQVLEEATPTSDNPTGARFELTADGPRPVPGVDAQVCCEEGSGSLIVDALLDGATTVELPARTVTAAEGAEWAGTLGVTEVIGEFTTRHSCCENRVDNIHLISDLTRGVLIPPGATFSVNDFVGERTPEKGFKEAGVIEEGKLTTDYGGGISQYATTLFNAAFFAGLDIPEYKAHSRYIARYPFGREATLDYPSVDLKVTNNTPYGVAIFPSYTETSVTVQLWSTRWVAGDQTGQNRSSGCGRIVTERTRLWVNGDVETDEFYANYDCDPED